MTTIETEIMNIIISNYLLKNFEIYQKNNILKLHKHIILIQEELVSEISKIFSIPELETFIIIKETFEKLKLKPFILSLVNFNSNILSLQKDKVILEDICNILKTTKIKYAKTSAYEMAAKYNNMERTVQSLITKY